MSLILSITKKRYMNQNIKNIRDMATTGETKMALHAELNPMEKGIIKTLDGRSFDRIQMQMPFDESSIMFLVAKEREHSSFWTNCLIELVNHDLKLAGEETPYTSTFYPPPLKKLDNVFKDGLVKLPPILNYKGTVGHAEMPTNCCVRALNGLQDCGAMLNGLIDDFRKTERGQIYTLNDPTHKWIKQSSPVLEWFCPTVPSGSIVVWHGFHTTKGYKNDTSPKATMFLDYTETGVLSKEQREYYVKLIRSQPFDPGSGNLNGRSSRATIEFNAAKEISQAATLPQTKMVGGLQVDTTVGSLNVNRDTILRRGYGVITPVVNIKNEDANSYVTRTGRFPWFMSPDELDTFHKLRQQSKEEFQSFLTYFVFEREMRFLTYWLIHHGRKTALLPLWKKMTLHTELFDPETRCFKWMDDYNIIVKHYGFPDKVKMGNLRYKYNQKKTDEQKKRKISRERYILENMTSDELVEFHYNSWFMLFKHARLLDISIRKDQPNWNSQKKCWLGMFGGDGQSAGKAAADNFNDNYFMYWRENMGTQGPKKTEPNKKDAAMCIGTTLAQINEFIERKVRHGPAAHMHKRCGQGGGKIIAGDSGMGGGTTYTAGAAHLELQTGPVGATLAHAFYKEPLVVLERFRVKTHASWGAGHVDHSVQSRLVINDCYAPPNPDSIPPTHPPPSPPVTPHPTKKPRSHFKQFVVQEIN